MSTLAVAVAEAADCMRQMAEWATATGMPDTAAYLTKCASELEAENGMPPVSSEGSP